MASLVLLADMFLADPGGTLTAVALGMVPLAIVMPVLVWLDRVEPEPWSTRIHAFLWGAVVAGSISGFVNVAVAERLGLVWAITSSAPLIEELTKGLGVLWALRRRELDGVMDGIVFAGWVALGFAVIENFTYFSEPDSGVALAAVFIMRALLTPFAHPLFTAWIGLAVGLAVSRGQSVLINGLWGYGLAAASHATWNGVITYSSETGNGRLVAVAALFFIALFAAAAVTVARIRSHEQRLFNELAPALAERYGLPTARVAIFTNWRSMLATRRSLPDEERAAFDQMHSTLARLALHHRREGAGDPAAEPVLVSQLEQVAADHDLDRVLPSMASTSPSSGSGLG